MRAARAALLDRVGADYTAEETGIQFKHDDHDYLWDCVTGAFAAQTSIHARASIAAPLRKPRIERKTPRRRSRLGARRGPSRSQVEA